MTLARRILGACDEVVRQQVGEHGGREIKSTGDGFMIAFGSPRKAVACALAIQDAVTRRGNAVRVRAGLHTGEVSEEGAAVSTFGGVRSDLQGTKQDAFDSRPALTEAKSLNADAVFFGGVASDGSGLISAQMQEIGLKATFLGGDGSVDPQYFIDGGVSGDNKNNQAYASSAPDATGLASAQAFNAVYTRTFSQQPVSYSAYGYDCMNILLDAMRQVILRNGGTHPSDPAAFRTAVAQQVGKEDWKGTIGETRFNAQGDTLNKAFTIYRATGGNWVGVETVSPKAG